jgi:hypothetical protein
MLTGERGPAGREAGRSRRTFRRAGQAGSRRSDRRLRAGRAVSAASGGHSIPQAVRLCACPTAFLAEARPRANVRGRARRAQTWARGKALVEALPHDDAVRSCGGAGGAPRAARRDHGTSRRPRGKLTKFRSIARTSADHEAVWQ